MSDILDVVIIGAGLSGIGAACHLKRHCPQRKVAILEARERSGGTWDLFRYPGIRSDSDMHTLGYSFKPWEASKAIADGPSILSYVRETAKEYGVDSLIRYQQKVKQAHWHSEQQCWELTIEDGNSGALQTLKTRFLHLCAGYYSYSHGHQPDFPGRDDFKGEFIHPQFWPDDLDYENKRVLVIGSGATAMTLVPSMADKAAEVVMLQRSPTWVVSRPSKDWIANFLRAVLPKNWAYSVTRWKNTRMQHWVYKKSRKQPEKLRQMLLDQTKKELGDAGDLADFTPTYNPWDQRLCLVPDSDLFAAIHSGKARVVTNQIDTLTAEGVRLVDGSELAADIIVSATGLELELFGGVEIKVDGEIFDFASSWSYRGMMCTGLPNLVSVFGYINASWTLRADLVSQWMCRLLAHMDAKGETVVTPALEEGLPIMSPKPWIDDFSAGYMQRVMHLFPRQGDRPPWVNSQNYLREKREFEEMDFAEPALRYESPAAVGQAEKHAA
ncbi:monooxygenase, flavin-binding family [gamma proteobacterium NOR5-3]|nr:monooxygenase, flavin-binding family [gamma proteobacterium NOR5-3]